MRGFFLTLLIAGELAGCGFNDCGHLKDSKGVQAKPHCT